MVTDLSPVYELRSKFIVIGLTGRTGSGCTSTAEILSKSTFEDCKFPELKSSKEITNDERKELIVYDYLKHNWEQFTVINVSNVITSCLLDHSWDECESFLKKDFAQNNSLQVNFDQIESLFKETHKEYINIEHSTENGAFVLYDFYYSSKNLSQLTSLLKEKFSSQKTSTSGTLYQTFGANLRSSGKPFDATFSIGKVYTISERINALIKAIKRKNNENAHILIDSIRNPIESLFFKERYGAYYLFALNTENEYRQSRLFKKFRYTIEQIETIDKIEYKNQTGKNKFFSQDIKGCLQSSDVYLYNPTDESPGDSFYTLKMQLVKYIALLLHPGLITPSPVERCMQIAYTAKYNSGCISRQVGAVISDNIFSIKAVGWNNTAEGQVPCLLRNIHDLNRNDTLAFSDYELSEKFKSKISEHFTNIQNPDYSTNLRGRNLSFCFKEIQYKIDNEKNQVHTRSLHAEENAFLQLSKYGGTGIKGGLLFTTASPCELCSKKAYQLGITRIFYIEPYPGISESHILKSGHVDKRPKLELFKGAIGRAYHQLYQPFLPYKDELQVFLNLENYNNKSCAEYKSEITTLLSENDKLSALNQALNNENNELRKKFKNNPVNT